MISFFFQDQPYGGGDVGGGPFAALGMGIMIVYFVILVLMFAGLWKVFAKAGKPGWAAIIPIYNGIVALEIVGKPVWWIILLLIPFVGFFVAIPVCIALAKKFGKGAGYGIGLWLLSPIFLPMLGFGSSQYNPNAAT